MDDQQTRTAPLSPATEREILARIVNAMLAAEEQLCQASEQEWTRVLTDSCRRQKRVQRELLVTTC